MNTTKYILPCLKIAEDASEAILKIYERQDYEIEKKNNKTPITIADKNSHEIIRKGLKGLTPEIPILSEEGKDISYEERKNWENFWLVDPLDGTKEFIKRNGEFTVNIALIDTYFPILGIVYAPLTGERYIGGEDIGAYKVKENVELDKLDDISHLLEKSDKLPLGFFDEPFTVIASRSHRNKETQEYIDNLKKKHENLKVINRGSALKLCAVAEGNADVYPRLSPTYEWDIGAGHAIVEAMGGEVKDLGTGESLEYNKENLVNNNIIASKSSLEL